MSQKIQVKWLITILVLAVSVTAAQADSFGTGANQFSIDFVGIGNPGNGADTTGAPNPAGSVPYVYRMGKYEVSRDMITKANTEGSLLIPLTDMSSYGYGDNRANAPATGLNWNQAARFVNWLNTSEGFTPAYKFAVQPGEVGYNANAYIDLWQSGDVGYNSANLFRNDLAHYFLPSVDEWYKAAYYDPTSSSYFNFATGSDTFPTPVASGTTAGTAVYGQTLATGPADITLAGGLSPYGTMGQGGNVREWEETELDLVNNSAGSPRDLRGGWWLDINYVDLGVSIRNSSDPTNGHYYVGFRVASVPEPTTITMLLYGLASLALLRRRW